MADLETKYGEDAAQALYMWRFAGVSFGLEARFWWTLLFSRCARRGRSHGAVQIYHTDRQRTGHYAQARGTALQTAARRSFTAPAAKYRERVRREDHDVAELMALIQRDCSVEIARREI